MKTAWNGGIYLKTIKNLFHQKNRTDNIASFIVGAVFIIIIGILTYSIIVKKQENKETASTTQQTQLPTEHVVQNNESLWTISEKYFQSGYNWVDLADANAILNPDYIAVGQRLLIPDVKPIIIESGQIASAIAPKHAQVTVQEGDTLWNIAVKEYGSGYEWSDIAKLNAISNPDLIYPGSVLRLQ
jgi:nucleoid-associated protein YgaU